MNSSIGATTFISLFIIAIIVIIIIFVRVINNWGTKKKEKKFSFLKFLVKWLIIGSVLYLIYYVSFVGSIYDIYKLINSAVEHLGSFWAYLKTFVPENVPMVLVTDFFIPVGIAILLLSSIVIYTMLSRRKKPVKILMIGHDKPEPVEEPKQRKAVFDSKGKIIEYNGRHYIPLKGDYDGCYAIRNTDKNGKELSTDKGGDMWKIIGAFLLVKWIAGALKTDPENQELQLFQAEAHAFGASFLAKSGLKIELDKFVTLVPLADIDIGGVSNDVVNADLLSEAVNNMASDDDSSSSGSNSLSDDDIILAEAMSDELADYALDNVDDTDSLLG